MNERRRRRRRRRKAAVTCSPSRDEHTIGDSAEIDVAATKSALDNL
jgi:hypothetical protein